MYPFSLSIHLLIEKQFNLCGNTHRYSQRWVFQMILNPVKLIVKTIQHRCVSYKDFASLVCSTRLWFPLAEAFSFYVVLLGNFPGSFLCCPAFLRTSLPMPVFEGIRHLDLLTLHLQCYHSSLTFLYLPHSHSFFPTKGIDAPSQFAMGSLETQFPKRGSHIDIGVS